jgi:hypothetical protein
MKTFKIISILFIHLLSALLISCDDIEYDPIKFKIICVGANFNGYYIVDGGSTKSFDSTDTEILSSNTYQYEREIKELDFIEISATIEGTSSASITIKIYRDKIRVKETTMDVAQDETNRTLKLDYEYGEENTEESTE